MLVILLLELCQLAIDLPKSIFMSLVYSLSATLLYAYSLNAAVH